MMTVMMTMTMVMMMMMMTIDDVDDDIEYMMMMTMNMMIVSNRSLPNGSNYETRVDLTIYQLVHLKLNEQTNQVVKLYHIEH